MIESLVAPENIDYMCGIARNVPAGCFVEFGVYKGGSAWRLNEIVKAQGREFHLYDTFTGIPFADACDQFPVNHFGDASLGNVREAIPNAVFHVGVFPETFNEDIGPIAFCHIDADQYRSIKAGWEKFSPLMVPGGVMIFDDYPVIESARIACDEVCGDRIQLELGKGIVRF